jgi:hypothetical protein
MGCPHGLDAAVVKAADAITLAITQAVLFSTETFAGEVARRAMRRPNSAVFPNVVSYK